MKKLRVVLTNGKDRAYYVDDEVTNESIAENPRIKVYTSEAGTGERVINTAGAFEVYVSEPVKRLKSKMRRYMPEHLKRYAGAFGPHVAQSMAATLPEEDIVLESNPKDEMDLAKSNDLSYEDMFGEGRPEGVTVLDEEQQPNYELQKKLDREFERTGSVSAAVEAVGATVVGGVATDKVVVEGPAESSQTNGATSARAKVPIPGQVEAPAPAAEAATAPAADTVQDLTADIDIASEGEPVVADIYTEKVIANGRTQYRRNGKLISKEEFDKRTQ